MRHDLVLVLGVLFLPVLQPTAAHGQDISKALLPSNGVWKARFDGRLDGELKGAREVSPIRITVRNNRISWREGDHVFAGEISAGTTPLVTIRQDGPNGFVAVHSGKLVKEGHIVTTWFNNQGGSGDFELVLDTDALNLETEAFVGLFHVMRTKSRQIAFTYTITAETPDERVEKWVVNLPEPPATGSQTIDKVEFAVKGIAAEWTKNKDTSPLRRGFLSTVLGTEGGAAGKITVTANYTATMYERRLSAGKSPVPVEMLSAEEVKAFTAPTFTCDYRDVGVQEWIKKHGLTKTKGETPLRFASRAFQAVQKHLRYELPNDEADFFRCSRTVKKGRGDCGASNLLFCGILRNSGIPARVYCGRMVLNPKPGDSHSRGEFFVESVGWVPVDATAPVGDGRVDFRRFWTDPGQYFATSLETDWGIDLPGSGIQRLAWIHQYIVPFRSNRKATWDGFKLRESFVLIER
jgi:hypothetical protein